MFAQNVKMIPARGLGCLFGSVCVCVCVGGLELIEPSGLRISPVLVLMFPAGHWEPHQEIKTIS